MTGGSRQQSLYQEYQEEHPADAAPGLRALERYLAEFTLDGTRRTVVDELVIDGGRIPRYSNEFWTAAQRRGLSLHEISYRACFKPQLPRFFIELFTRERDTVYDPFMGRGTTLIEAASLGRHVAGNDVNPLAAMLTRPRLNSPDMEAVAQRLEEIDYDYSLKAEIDLSMFYHPHTEAEILSLQRYLAQRTATGEEDDIDRWIRMVATNRLTGHSSGFFSVYTLPPNQAVSPQSQLKINAKRGQQPSYRNTKTLILRKTASLLRRLDTGTAARLKAIAASALFTCRDAGSVPEVADASVALTVTSPPFLNVVQYAADNWLRCWFNGIDAGIVGESMTVTSSVDDWSESMGNVFQELYRITRPGGWVAFEVGEIKRGRIRLDEHVIPLGLSAGFACRGIIINEQQFTKTSNCWGIVNNRGGTNSNRVVLFKRS